MIRHAPCLRRVRRMGDRRDLAAPRDPDHLRRLIGHHAPAGRFQRAQALGDMGRDEVVEDGHRRRLEIGQAGERVARGRLAVMVAVDEDERPAAAGFAEADDRLGTGLRNENGRGFAARRADRRFELGPPVRVRQQRLDDMQRAEARGDEMGGRPAAPGADLEPRPPGEQTRAGVKDRGLVAVDEADDRVAPVGAIGMVDVAPQPGPSRHASVEFLHVGEQPIESGRFEIGGDVVSGHRKPNPSREPWRLHWRADCTGWTSPSSGAVAPDIAGQALGVGRLTVTIDPGKLS